MAYHAILFDIDNTLINSANLIAETLRTAAIKVENVEAPLEKYRQLIGQPGDKILRSFGVKDPETVLRYYMKDFTSNMHKLVYFPGIESLFEKLKHVDLKIGVVTSKNRFQFDQETKYFPMIANTKIVTTSDLTAKPKPSGDPLIYTIKTNGLDPSTTLYVGDSVYDMRAANEAKIDFAAAGWGALPDEKFENAKYLLKKPEDLLKLVSL
ncbi:HAD family hydrolase [Lactiplantibacillus plajomi]|uniref:HAD family hydrolase n=1 Tax=Lactiplantibacillus plajomi TaxID=1457217 RepID=A0ABV6K2L6_9LACO|nr:HAD-IA family hydrolase [Lactiplantibacillus plajomi]